MAAKIDTIDRRILLELEHNARIPDVQLAKLVKKSKDAVRYRIRKLEEAGIITGYLTWVDYAKLGYRSSTLTFRLASLPKARKQLIAEIKADKRVSWIGIAEGAWNVQATYAYRTNQELYDLKCDLLSRYPELILSVDLTSVVGVYVHEKSFLINKHSRFTHFIDTIETVEIDRTAERILAELFHDARQNIATIAASLGTTVDIVRNRIRRMEESHVIVRYSAIIDYPKIGYDLYKAFLYLKSSTKDEIDAIIRYAEGSDRIIHLVKQIAPWDIELIVFAPSFTEYNRFIGEFTERFAKQVRNVETAIMSEDVLLPAKKMIFE